MTGKKKTTKKKATKKAVKKTTSKVAKKTTKKRVVKKKAKKRGRPTSFTQAKWNKILNDLMYGVSLRTICADPKMPSRFTVMNWMASNDVLLNQYARAKDIGIDEIVEEAIEIADDGTNDYNKTFDKKGQFKGWQLNQEHVQRSRLRVDTRKWYASKLASKRYGERTKFVTDDGDGNDAPINALGEEERAIRISTLLNAAKARRDKEGKKK